MTPIAALTLSAALATGAATPPPLSPSLRSCLQGWVAARPFGSDRSTRVTIARARLGGRNDQSVVYLSGPNWCGSGGCTLLVIEPRGRGWRVIDHTTISRPPVRRLRTVHHCYHDIGVQVSGGGIVHGYQAAVPFDGRRYVVNPTVPPARRVSDRASGQTLIAPDAPSQALFP